MGWVLLESKIEKCHKICMNKTNDHFFENILKDNN